MTGIDNRMGRKGEQLCGDAVHQHVKVSGWQIGPADGIPEQYITGYDKSILFAVKTDMTIGMTGGKEYPERGGAPGDHFPVFEVSPGFGNMSEGKTERRADLFGRMEEKFRIPMILRSNSVVFSNEFVAQNMVDMTMGIQVPDQFEPMVGYKTGKLVPFLFIITGSIDQNGIRSTVPEQVSVHHESIESKSLYLNHKETVNGLQRYEIAPNHTFFITFTGSIISVPNPMPIHYRRLIFAAFATLVSVMIALIPGKTAAQFYNGSQLSFGKNRVQYGQFLWQYYRFNKFDTYYYQGGLELAQYTCRYAETHIREIETMLQSSLDEKIQFIVFNRLSDLKQSNIGLYNDWEYYNTGGVTRIVGGRVLLFFDGQYEHFNQQLKSGIAQVILNNMMFGTGIGAQIKNNTLFTVPEWYMNGLISYISRPWDTELDNIVRDAVLNNHFKRFNSLTGEEATYAGHSFWHFVALKYGKSAIPNIIYIARLTRNVEKGFQAVIGLSYKAVMQEWLAHYRSVYEAEEVHRQLPGDLPLIRKRQPDKVFRALRVSPDGSRVAFARHDLGVYKVFVMDLHSGRKKSVLRGGYRMADRQDHSFPLIAWHPAGQALAIVLEKNGEIRMLIHDLETKTTETRKLLDFIKVTDLSWSDDGSLIVMSAVLKGQSDIFVYQMASGSHEQITDDCFDDLSPRFMKGSGDIIFSSNRPGDTLKPSPHVKPEDLSFRNDIFLYRYRAKSNVLQRLTNTPTEHETMPMPYSQTEFSYLSDYNGIVNRFLARYDSSIAWVDTTTHYRYFTTTRPVTNYPRNITEQDITLSGARLAEIVRINGTNRMYVRDLVPPEEVLRSEVFPSSLLMPAPKPALPPVVEITGHDSSAARPLTVTRAGKPRFNVVRRSDITRRLISMIDTGQIKVNAEGVRTFESKDSTMRSVWDLVRKLQGEDRPDSAKGTPGSTDPIFSARPWNYNVEYTIDQMVTQIDFTYLNYAYQPFTGSVNPPVFFNPGLNVLFMTGITDLMEDYRISGGVRLNVSLINNEYLFSYGNYKRRLDHQLVFHRKALEEGSAYYIVRHKIHELYYIATYPFTPVLNLKGTASLRYDRAVFLATDQYLLGLPDIQNLWGSLKAELTYDNTRSMGLNLYKGTRYKLFGEYYQLVTEKRNHIFVAGFDYRHYMQVHRTLIWANRLAASTSFGSNKLLYYMGGVDNWLFPSYNHKMSVDNSENYAFQTIATNMRGFKQNVRNGTNFFVFNTELRWPVFRYLFNRPIRSDIFNNFQVVLFGDVGTAWNGISPWDGDNPLFTSYISRGPLFIKVEMQKEPLIEGFGIGARTRLFGYFVRGDLAWGVEDGRIGKPLFYFSLSLDF